MRKTALVADDYTGAGDAGVHYLATGLPVTLVLPGPGWLRAPASADGVLAFSTESRFLPPGEAADIVFDVFDHCRQAGVEVFFKKIDSTLRGNPGAETEAALKATGRAAAVVCPAIPRLGRTVVGGVALLDGVPLVETEFGKDRFTPLASSRLDEIFAAQTTLPSACLGRDVLAQGRDAAARRLAELVDGGARLVMADAESEADLGLLAAMLSDRPDILPVGASGLTLALSRLYADASATDAPYTMKGRVLAVMGSLTSNAAAQTARALESGAYGRLVLDVEAARADIDAECSRLVEACASLEPPHILLRAETGGDGADKRLGLEVAGLLGEAAKRIMAECGCRTLFSTGGSTSLGIARALGLCSMRLEREIMPGTVAGTYAAAGGDTRWFVTKAGGFGGRETLVELLRFME